MKMTSVFKLKIITNIGVLGCLAYWVIYSNYLGLNKWIGAITFVLQLLILYLDVKDYKKDCYKK